MKNCFDFNPMLYALCTMLARRRLNVMGGDVWEVVVKENGAQHPSTAAISGNDEKRRNTRFTIKELKGMKGEKECRIAAHQYLHALHSALPLVLPSPGS